MHKNEIGKFHLIFIRDSIGYWWNDTMKQILRGKVKIVSLSFVFKKQSVYTSKLIIKEAMQYISL